MFLGKMCNSLYATKIKPSLKLLITENTIFTCITSRIIQENAVLTKSYHSIILCIYKCLHTLSKHKQGKKEVDEIGDS